MSITQQLPRRQVAPERENGAMAPVDFLARTETIDPASVAPDMGDLAARVRNLMALQQQQVLQLPLGGRFFDIVVTASGPQAYAAMIVMDEIQNPGDERADACGPVIEDPQRSWLIWLVPPGTSDQWVPHRSAVCLGRPHQIALPSMMQTEPPGPYWLRPCRGDRLVPPAALRNLLDQFQPGPPPHETLLGTVLSSIS
ncbi:hypothetical protein [Streptomyces kebangsaanensis]|uniref:hypothetical protein n=1 Tax=Streptomyces kebangsaanensis TaxID=864058 RepID=UPI000A91D7EF|nr:hypothetical protein [Streptomyces kebangsaanensis]